MPQAPSARGLPDRRRRLRRHAPLRLFAVAVALAPGAPLAQEKFPQRPLRIITGFLPGGVSDAIARTLAEKLTDRLGERVVVDGRPGAGGMLSMEIAARANPDGHTLYLAQPVVSIAAVTAKLAYDPVKAFATVSLVGSSPTLVVANPSLPVNSPAELIAFAKAKPGALNYGSSGHGGPNHLAAELFQFMAGVKMQHVPYKGAAAALPAVMANEVPLAFTPLLAGLPHVKAGRLKAVAVSSPKRNRQLPDTPSIGEALPGYEHVSWFGIVVPAATPKPIVARLNAELVRIMDMPDVRDRLLGQGVDPESSTPEAFARVIANDVKRWSRLIRETGIKIEQ